MRGGHHSRDGWQQYRALRARRRSLDRVTNLSTAYQQVLVTLRDIARSDNSEDMRQQVELRKAAPAWWDRAWMRWSQRSTRRQAGN